MVFQVVFVFSDERATRTLEDFVGADVNSMMSPVLFLEEVERERGSFT